MGVAETIAEKKQSGDTASDQHAAVAAGVYGKGVASKEESPQEEKAKRSLTNKFSEEIKHGIDHATEKASHKDHETKPEELFEEPVVDSQWKQEGHAADMQRWTRQLRQGGLKKAKE